MLKINLRIVNHEKNAAILSFIATMASVFWAIGNVTVIGIVKMEVMRRQRWNGIFLRQLVLFFTYYLLDT